MKTLRTPLVGALLCATAIVGQAATAQLLGWNNLGMHCMDSDYSVFSVLPPYNTIEAQLIVGGLLITNGDGYTVTYQAVADPSGSFNSTAMGKGNYYSFATALYGPTLAPEAGLAGWSMPGPSNTPQTMLFEQTNRPAPIAAALVNWFRAEGIPIAPFDDAGLKNPYPMMRVIARNAANQPIATNDIVLPVSDEMDCRVCHASGAGNDAKPAGGWVWSSNRERDFRLNILRLHDEHQFANHTDLYQAALAARGFNAKGLFHGVIADGKPVLCATCHASEALGTDSYSTIPPLTASVHSKHATVMDPDLHITLDSSAHRAACYRCHPGSATRCLRGAMGGAIANDGTMSMQCQSCHGNMSQVGSSARVGWFMEPNCQSCHTGTATNNNGQIRYTSALETNGLPRVAINKTFATLDNTPAPGISLYRFSSGHGGLQCSACHGSTHAEFPATHRNDNVRNERIQGHGGMMIECTACHVSMPVNANTATNGPHGMHPIGQPWINGHPDLIKSNYVSTAQCKTCHGSDSRGTVLSRTQTDRSLSAFGSKKFFRGAQIGCYTCHSSPTDDNANTNAPPSVTNVSTNTSNDQSVSMTLPVIGVGATLRIVSQPTNGAVGLVGGQATYFPNPGFVGTDKFTFAAYDGSKNSNLGTGAVAVAQGPFTLTASAMVPPSYPAEWVVAFSVVARTSNTLANVTYDWDFGDGSAHSPAAFTMHTFATPGTYPWTVISSVTDGATQLTVTNTGTITITPRLQLSPENTGDLLQVSWLNTPATAVLEQADQLKKPTQWFPSTNNVSVIGDRLMLNVPSDAQQQFFRLRQAQ